MSELDFEKINNTMHKDLYWQAGEIDRLKQENAKMKADLARYREALLKAKAVALTEDCELYRICEETLREDGV